MHIHWVGYGRVHASMLGGLWTWVYACMLYVEEVWMLKDMRMWVVDLWPTPVWECRGLVSCSVVWAASLDHLSVTGCGCVVYTVRLLYYANLY